MPATNYITFASCDLCGNHKNDTSGDFRVSPPVFRDFGGVQNSVALSTLANVLKANRW